MSMEPAKPPRKGTSRAPTADLRVAEPRNERSTGAPRKPKEHDRVDVTIVDPNNLGALGEPDKPDDVDQPDTGGAPDRPDEPDGSDKADGADKPDGTDRPDAPGDHEPLLPEPGPADGIEDASVKAAREAYNAAVTKFNDEVLAAIPKLIDDDRKIGIARFTALIVLGSIMVGSTVLVIITSFTATTPTPVVVSGAIVIVSLLFAGWTNPLQTLERDMVFRRWSDVIVSSFVMGAGSWRAGPKQIEAAATAASTRFSALAVAYSALASKSGDVLTDLAKAGIAAGATAAPTPTQITVTNPGNQAAAMGKELTPPLAIVATGPGTLSYKDVKLPAGLSMDPGTGKVTGTPTFIGETSVVVTVSSSDDTAPPASVQFVITVKADAN